MVVFPHTLSHADRNTGSKPVVRSSQARSMEHLTRGQSSLLDLIPTTGDVIDLSAAIRLVSIGEHHAYGSIVTLMNRGLVAAEFIDAPSVDPEIVIRRL